MSIRIYPVDPELVAARLGLRMQLDALAPFPSPRQHAAPWGFDRDPFMHLLPPFVYGRAKFDLGEEIPSDVEAAPEIEREARAPAAARAGGTPETLSFNLNRSALPPSATIALAISTETIPWPWQIVQLDFTYVTAGFSRVVYNFFATDNEYTTFPFDTPEEKLIKTIAPDFGPLTADNFGPSIAPRAVVNASEPHFVRATGPLGRRVREAGKRLTLAFISVDGTSINLTCEITIQRADGVSADAGAAPARRVTAPRTPIAAPALELTGIQKAQAEVTARREAAGLRVQFIGTFSTPAQATEIANILREKGETARARVFDDAARRMERGASLTPEQEQNLALGAGYTPRVTRISFQRPSGAAAQVYQQLLRSQSDLG